MITSVWIGHTIWCKDLGLLFFVFFLCVKGSKKGDFVEQSQVLDIKRCERCSMDAKQLKCENADMPKY